MSAPREATRPWLLGPLPDLLLGCGLGYALLVAVLAALGTRMDALSGWLPLVILVTGIPHYGATLLRVYSTANARRRYARAAFHLGAAVWAVFAVSLGNPRVGAWFITLYLTWSPWHYTGQNFGLAMMYLHRGGVLVSPSLRRLVHASFVLSFVAVFLSIHSAAARGSSDPLIASSDSYRFVPLGIPHGFAMAALGVAGIAYIAVTAMMVWQLMRQGGAVRLLPVMALVVSQAAWFLLPILLGVLAPGLVGPGGPTALAFIWVAIAHSVQYLWISIHYARASGQAGAAAGATLRYLLAATLAGTALWVVPALACAPGALGRLPYESGLGLLVAAAVNVHHFILDGAIWRLRDAPVRDALVARTAPAHAAPVERSWIGRAAVCAAGIVAVSCWILATWEDEVGRRRAAAAGDIERLETAARRLALVGRDGPRVHAALGRLRARRGEEREALAAYQRSLELHATPGAWVGVGRIHEARRDLDAARDAYLAAIALDPGHAAALDHLAAVWIARGEWGKALETRYRAAVAAPDEPAIRRRYEELLALLSAQGSEAPEEEIVVVGKEDEARLEDGE